MARLATSGFETQIGSATSQYDGETNNGTGGSQAQFSGAPTFNTSTPRSGLACLSCAAASISFRWSVVLVLDRTYYARAYLRVGGLPLTNEQDVLSFFAGGVNCAYVKLTTSSTLQLADTSGNIGSPSAAISANTWYRVELECRIPTSSTGIAGLYLDGTQVARSTTASVGNAVTTSSLRAGWTKASVPGQTILIDDAAINDDQGADQNSLPGSGKVIHLKPTTDSSIGNWVGPQTTGDDTTNLWDNVDSNVPAGVAHSDVDANANRYVFNIVSAANQNFDVGCQTYTAAGLTGSDSITLVQAIARMSCNTTTGTNTGAVAGVSNPAITAVTGGNLEQTAVAGTEPTGWKCYRTAPSYAPSVTLGTAPVIRATKEVANTNAAMADLLALLVEYVAVNAWSQTPAETPSVTDAQAKAIKPAQADSATGTDAQAKAVKPLKADTLTATEAVGKRVIPATKADTATITDSVTPLIIRTQAVPDTATVTDASTRRVTSLKTETPAVTDAIAKRSVPATKAETLTVTEAVAKRVIPAAKAESLTVIDGLVTLEGEAETQSVSDAATVTDSVTTLEGEAEFGAVDDLLTVADAVATDLRTPILVDLDEILALTDTRSFEMVGLRTGAPGWASEGNLPVPSSASPVATRQTASPIGRPTTTAVLTED